MGTAPWAPPLPERSQPPRRLGSVFGHVEDASLASSSSSSVSLVVLVLDGHRRRRRAEEECPSGDARRRHASMSFFEDTSGGCRRSGGGTRFYRDGSAGTSCAAGRVASSCWRSSGWPLGRAVIWHLQRGNTTDNYWITVAFYFPQVWLYWFFQTVLLATFNPSRRWCASLQRLRRHGQVAPRHHRRAP